MIEQKVYNLVPKQFHLLLLSEMKIGKLESYQCSVPLAGKILLPIDSLTMQEKDPGTSNLILLPSSIDAQSILTSNRCRKFTW